MYLWERLLNFSSVHICIKSLGDVLLLPSCLCVLNIFNCVIQHFNNCSVITDCFIRRLYCCNSGDCVILKVSWGVKESSKLKWTT